MSGVDVGIAEGVRVAWGVCEAIGGMGVGIGAGWSNGEQAVIPARILSDNIIRLIA